MPQIKISVTKKAPAEIFWGHHKTPFGPMMLGVDAVGSIWRFDFAKGKKAADILKEWKKVWPLCSFEKDQENTGSFIEDIFSDEENLSPLSVSLMGSEFQIKVWKAIAKIKCGKTQTYADLAQKIKSPKAVRAVGTACGANPVPVLIPCHRVLSTNDLGGFGGGLPLKRKMLKAEGVL